jgi:4-hydroxybenzoyl-CoA reductase subunit beta
MHLPRFDYRRASSLPEASGLLTKEEGPSCLMAGGTDLLPRLKYGLLKPQRVVGLKGLTARAPTVSADGELVLDAMLTLAEVITSPAVQTAAPALAEAAACVGSNQIRHMGTLGGNLCLETRCLYYNQSHAFQFTEPCLKRDGDLCYFAPKAKRCYAVFAADTPPVLISLDAEVEIVGPGGERRTRLEDLYTGDALEPVSLERGELISRVFVPAASPGEGSAFVKFSLRGGVEFAGVSVAARLQLDGDGSTCCGARIVVGAVAGRPLRAREAEESLVGRTLTAESLEAIGAGVSTEVRPVAHHGYSAAYLRHCLGVQAKEALLAAWERSQGRTPHDLSTGGAA